MFNIFKNAIYIIKNFSKEIFIITIVISIFYIGIFSYYPSAEQEKQVII
jgi:hypothetical protein